MKCSVLRLYHPIIVPILSDWVFDEDLCSLDTAVCNHELRNDTLKVISKCSIVNTNSNHRHEERYEWIMLRSIRLRKGFWSEGLSDHANSCLLQLLKRSQYLDHLEVSLQSMEPLLDAIASNLQVDSLKLKCPFSEILKVVERFPNMSKLDISQCVLDNVPDNFYDQISHHCHELKRISVSGYADLPSSLENCTIDRIGHYFQSSGGEQLFNCLLKLQSTTSHDESTIKIGSRHYFLKELDCRKFLERNKVESLSPYLIHLESLTYFGLVTRQWLKVISRDCRNLTSLVVCNSEFEESKFIELIKICGKLKRLEIDNCRGLSDSAFVSVAKHCQCLEQLVVAYCPLDEATVVQILVSCPLKLFNINVTDVTVHTLKYVANDLERLVLRRSIASHTIDFSTVCRLKSLLFASTFPLASNGFKKAFVRNQTLLHIEFDRQLHLTDEAISLLVRYCQNVKSVSILECPSVTEDSLLHLGQCRHLNVLVLHSLRVSNDYLETFFMGKPNLIKLGLRCCKGYTGEMLHFIAQYCINLMSIDVSYCNHVCDEDVTALLMGCSRLNCLVAECCSGIFGGFFSSLLTRPFRYLNIKASGISKTVVEEFVGKTGFGCSFAFEH